MKAEKGKDENEIVIYVDNIDDLWYLNTLISKGDIVWGYVFRKDIRSDDMKRAKNPVRKKLRVAIEVEKVEFQEFADRLRITGKIVMGNEDYIGAYQTINVGVGDKISVIKEWSKEDKKILEEGIKNSEKPQVYFLGLEHGLATMAILRGYGIQEIATIRKRGEEDEEFFGEVLNAIKKIRDEKLPLIILGPGFYKENFVKFAGGLKNFVVMQSSHGDMRGIHEVLKSSLNKILKEHRVAKEEKLIDSLLKEIKKEGFYAYGEKEVKKYLEIGAVKILLITDKNYKKYEKILKMAEEIKAEIHIISTSHEAGKILQNLGGIAAFLRFR